MKNITYKGLKLMLRDVNTDPQQDEIDATSHLM